MNNTHYKEIRTLSRSDLRALCIDHNWYASGTTAEYENLLSLTEKENITTEDIIIMAADIMNHSVDNDRPLESYCFEIARICDTFFEEI